MIFHRKKRGLGNAVLQCAWKENRHTGEQHQITATLPLNQELHLNKGKDTVLTSWESNSATGYSEIVLLFFLTARRLTSYLLIRFHVWTSFQVLLFTAIYCAYSELSGRFPVIAQRVGRALGTHARRGSAAGGQRLQGWAARLNMVTAAGPQWEPRVLSISQCASPAFQTSAWWTRQPGVSVCWPRRTVYSCENCPLPDVSTDRQTLFSLPAFFLSA